MNKPRVFADFHNADAKGRVRLNCAGTMTDIERQEIELQNGQFLILYSEELEVESVVHYSEEEKLWTAVIDWDAIQDVKSVDTRRPDGISSRTIPYQVTHLIPNIANSDAVVIRGVSLGILSAR